MRVIISSIIFGPRVSAAKPRTAAHRAIWIHTNLATKRRDQTGGLIELRPRLKPPPPLGTTLIPTFAILHTRWTEFSTDSSTLPSSGSSTAFMTTSHLAWLLAWWTNHAAFSWALVAAEQNLAAGLLASNMNPPTLAAAASPLTSVLTVAECGITGCRTGNSRDVSGALDPMRMLAAYMQ